MLQKGASIDEKNRNGNTALLIATIRRRLNILTKLIDKGANINIRNNENDNALSKALEINDDEIIKELSKHDTEMPTEGKDGANALQRAAEKGQSNYFEALVKRGAKYKYHPESITMYLSLLQKEFSFFKDKGEFGQQKDMFHLKEELLSV